MSSGRNWRSIWGTVAITLYDLGGASYAVSRLIVVASLNPVANAECDASCVGYSDPLQINCSGGGGCQSFYMKVFCSSGCTCGDCASQGSSGQCCGRIYYLAVVYGNGEGGCECGDVKQHAQTHSNRLNPEGRRTVDLRQDYSPGLIMLTATESVREAGFGYAYNRCAHNYQLVFEVDQPEKHGG